MSCYATFVRVCGMHASKTSSEPPTGEREDAPGWTFPVSEVYRVLPATNRPPAPPVDEPEPPF